METIRNILAPTGKKLLLTLVVTLFAHLYITVSQFRTATHQDLSAVQDFWLTNLINGLPYLETDNTPLKFLTFFAISYLLVWAVSRLSEIITALRTAIAKRTEKT